MALVVFLRGVNVGGHRTFRPSVLAKELSAYDIVNVGAAGTFVVRKPGARAAFQAALRKKLPFETEIMLCDGSDLLDLIAQEPFGARPAPEGTVRFISILAKPGTAPRLPVSMPAEGDWLVRLIEARERFVLGEYRRHMHTIRYLGQVDKLFGATATTRNWNTINSIAKILQPDGSAKPKTPSPKKSSRRRA
jgi:uncharacterized protein (DUF1697 family)